MKFPDDEQISHFAYQKHENEMYRIYGPNWEKLAPDELKEHLLLQWREKVRFQVAKKILWIELSQPFRSVRNWLSKVLDRNHCKD